MKVSECLTSNNVGETVGKQLLSCIADEKYIKNPNQIPFDPIFSLLGVYHIDTHKLP